VKCKKKMAHGLYPSLDRANFYLSGKELVEPIQFICCTLYDWDNHHVVKIRIGTGVAGG